MTELLPCPFCGGPADFERKGTARQSCIIACGDCGCRLESNEVWNSGNAWNHREAITDQAAGAQEPSTFDDDPVVIELREVERIVSDERVSNEAIGMRLRNTLAATNALSMLASLKQRIDQLVAGAPDRDAVTRIINGIYGIGAGTYAGGHQDKSISRAVDSILKLYQSAPGAGTVTSAQGAMPATKFDEQAERNAFIDAHCRSFDLTEISDAWGRPLFRHSHIEAMWDGWKKRAALGAHTEGERKCPECGWSGGGVRDEGCMISPCPRMPSSDSKGPAPAISLLREGSLDMTTVERIAWKKRVDQYLASLPSTSRGSAA